MVASLRGGVDLSPPPGVLPRALPGSALRGALFDGRSMLRGAPTDGPSPRDMLAEGGCGTLARDAASGADGRASGRENSGRAFCGTEVGLATFERGLFAGADLSPPPGVLPRALPGSALRGALFDGRSMLRGAPTDGPSPRDMLAEGGCGTLARDATSGADGRASGRENSGRAFCGTEVGLATFERGLFSGAELTPPWPMPRFSSPPAFGGRGTDRGAMLPRSGMRILLFGLAARLGMFSAGR